MKPLRSSLVALASLVALSAILAWVDNARGGPATMLSRCNLALARSDAPAADVLLIGSSRSGVAFDPIAIQSVLQREIGTDLTVDRLAIGNITLRLSEALLGNYLQHRGAPKVVLLETTFMTPRTVQRLAPAADGKPSEHYLLARDLNLMTFSQLLAQPAVAMPYTEPETPVTLWQFRLRSTISRAGALIYQFASAPFDGWSLEECDRTDFTHEPTWPGDFSFSLDEYRIEGALSDVIGRLTEELVVGSNGRELQDWQLAKPEGQLYPYDFNAAYRQGEMVYFREMVKKSRSVGANVLVLPMPLYSYAIDPDDLRSLQATLPEEVEIIDIYGEVGPDLSMFWYDDAHIEKYPAGVLTTALLSQRLVSLLSGERAHRD